MTTRPWPTKDGDLYHEPVELECCFCPQPTLPGRYVCGPCADRIARAGRQRLQEFGATQPSRQGADAQAAGPVPPKGATGSAPRKREAA